MGLFPKDRDLTRAPDRVELVVDASELRQRTDEVLVRLDRFLARHLTWRSRASIQELVREGHVLVDASTPEHPRGSGEALVERRPGRRLRHGSRVVVVIPTELRLPASTADGDALVVLYEDEDALAVDKPPLLPVHPSGRHASDTLIQRVHARERDAMAERGGAPRLCHRLDRETSGVVLVGKHPAAHRELARQFEEREVEKTYLAIVHGAVEADAGRIDYSLAPTRVGAIRLKMIVAADGLEARTDWRVVRRIEGYTLLACELHTGRQHQIRVHLAALGHPIVGDKLYGVDEELFQRDIEGRLDADDRRTLELPRHALHHHRLAFTARSGARVTVESPLPADLAEFVRVRGGELG